MQWALVSVALATTAVVRQEAASPVEKVVKLLTDMSATLQKEEKSDQEDFERLSCWCETNDKGKTAAIEQYEADVKDLGSQIEARTKKGQRLVDEIAKTNAELAQLDESKNSAEALRAKQGEENHASELDLTTNVESLKAAIIVLEKHQLKAFPQLKLDFLSMSSRSTLRTPDVLDKLSAWMEAHEYPELSKAAVNDVEHAVGSYLNSRDGGRDLNQYSAQEISALATAKKLVRTFAQTAAAPYIQQSGEIFGILKQLKAQLEKDLAEVQDREATEASQHAELMGQLKVQIDEAEQHLKNKETQAANNAKALADAKQDLEDTENNLDSDSKFLIELKATCSKSDEEWELRSAARKQEIAAVAEALSMLTTDDARDLFSSSLGFVQLASRTRQSARSRASAVLLAAGQKAGNQELVQLSAAVALDGFKKVKKAINEMIGGLKTEQADEVKHKDFCEGELHQNDLDALAKGDQIADLATMIDGLGNSIETLTSEIAAAKAAVADMEVQQQRASEDRVQENKVFQQTVADQRATAQILQKVISRLNEFYSLAQTRQTPQEEAYKAKNVVPPVKFDEYKKSGGASPVLSLIGNLVVDAKNLEKEAIKDENDAVAAYESFVSSTNASRSAKEGEVVDKTELRAEAEMDKEHAEADHKAAMQDAEELAKYAADLHKACDFVLKNFDTRQTARGQEIEALQSALAILSGMQ